MSAQGNAIVRQGIAEGNATKRAERERLVAEFRHHVGEYKKSCALVVQLQDARAHANAGIEQDEANMHGFEAGWVAKGVEGKNAEERKANLEAKKKEDKEYKGCAQRVAFEKRRIKVEIEPQIVEHEYAIRIARYEIESVIAQMQMIAGEDDERHKR